MIAILNVGIDHPQEHQIVVEALPHVGDTILFDGRPYEVCKVLHPTRRITRHISKVTAPVIYLSGGGRQLTASEKEHVPELSD